MPERQFIGTDDLGDELDDIISRSLGNALDAHSGTSATNLAAQIQQSVPLKNILEKVADEIGQGIEQMQDEITQQELVQQAISDFGSPTPTTTTTQRSTTTNKPSTKKLQRQIVTPTPEEMEIDGPVTNQPTEQTADTQPKSTPNTATNNTQETENTNETPSDEPSKPSVDDADEQNDTTQPPSDQDPEQQDDSQQTNNNPQQNQTNSLQQNAQLQQNMEMMSKQQLLQQRNQLQEKRKELQKKMGHSKEIEKTFRPDGIVLAVTILSLFVSIVNIIDPTEFLAIFFSIPVSILNIWTQLKTSYELKKYYIKKMPITLFFYLWRITPVLNNFPLDFVNHINTHWIGPAKKVLQATHMLRTDEKQLRKIDQQLKAINNQLSQR